MKNLINSNINEANNTKHVNKLIASEKYYQTSVYINKGIIIIIILYKQSKMNKNPRKYQPMILINPLQ